MKILPAKLKAARESKGIPSYKLAQLLHLTHEEYLEYEFGLDTNMPKMLIEKISFICSCAVSDFTIGYRRNDKDFSLFAHVKEDWILSSRYNSDNIQYIRLIKV